MSRRRDLAAFCVLAGGLVVVAFLLLVNSGDGQTYTCDRAPVGTFFHPQPQGSAAFDADFFDDGRVCNESARSAVGGAGVVLVTSAGLAVVVRRRRPAPRAPTARMLARRGRA